MQEQPRIAAVVLAAGRSTRLGRPKQLLPLGDRPLLAYVLRCVRRSSVDERYIVLGHASSAIEEAVDLTGFQVLKNPNYPDGQSTSVRIAVESIGHDVAAVIFVLGDQPLLAPDVIDRLADSYRDSPAPIIQPRFAEGPGNPVLIDHSLFGDLSLLTGDTGARPILHQQQELIRYIDVSDYHRPADVDTWEDYEKLKQFYAESDVVGDL